MKTAIAYFRLVAQGGAERAVQILARAFEADVWTTDYDLSSLYPEYTRCQVFAHPLRFRKIDRRLGFFSFIPGGLIQIESIRKFQRMDLSQYDCVISVGDMAKHIPLFNRKRLHYELSVRTEYRFTRLFKPWIDYLKKIDYTATQKLPVMTCNSAHIQSKIQRYYGRKAEVVYPAVDISMFKSGLSEDYFLAVERISPEKNIETQLEAFRIASGQKLLIVGSARDMDRAYQKKLEQQAPPNVKFLGAVTDHELTDLYSHALAAIQTHPDEDLGAIPIEAMASGKPCLAVNAGGFKETIVDGVTGRLIDPPYAQNLAEAISRFNKLDFNPDDCLARARLFSEEAHIEKMRTIIANL